LAGLSASISGTFSERKTAWLGREDLNPEMVNWKLRVPDRARFDVSLLSETIREDARNRAK
jgi:hypothetical protein